MRPALLLAVCLTLSAQNTDTINVMGGFLNGNEYLESDPLYRAAYGAGFVNGLSIAAPAMKTLKTQDLQWLEDCTKGMTDKQVGEIIRKHIQDQPDQWHFQLNVLGLNAMLKARAPYYAKPSVR